MEFSSLFPESLLFFLAISLLLISVLFPAALLLSWNQKTHRILISLFFACGFLLWFQGNILLWQYGVLNGRDIEWNSLIHYGIIDAALWIVVIIFSIVRADLMYRISRLMSLVLVIVQILTVLQGWISMPKDQGFKQKQGTTDTLFLFSTHVNVIILVLDTFQSDIFQDIVKEDADLRSSFDGFTYFRNSLAGSDGTSVSIPNMLTAKNYDNSLPYLDFVKKAFLDNSLPRTLKEYNFAVDLYPIIPYSVYADFSGMTSSRKKLMDWGVFSKEQASIADLALFRSVPHFMKQVIYNHQRWFISGFVRRFQDAKTADGVLKTTAPGASQTDNLKYSRELKNIRTMAGEYWDATFIDKVIRASGIVQNRDVFKFYHLNGIHLQLIMNEDLEYEEMSPTRDNMKRQGTGILKIAAIFLDRLKQMSAYDNSMIFIVGDHGSGLQAASIDPSPHDAKFNARPPYKGYFRSFKSAGIPLILVKRVNAKGEMRISDAPVALSDIPQTVGDELKLAAKFPGKSMFRVKADERRERIYRAFYGPQKNVKYLAPLYEYSINGFSWDDASWRETGNVYYGKSN